MGARGRKTVADKVVQIRALEELQAPAPPKGLNRAEAKEWREIVATYPADRFPRGTWPILEGYCTHTVEYRKIRGRIDELPADVSVGEYNRWLVMLDRETKAVASFGVRLGIARTSQAGRHNSDPETFAESDLPWKD